MTHSDPARFDGPAVRGLLDEVLALRQAIVTEGGSVAR